MIKEQDLLDAIAECQGERNPNANTCIKLAAYYTILNNISGSQVEAGGVTGYSNSGSEFSNVIKGQPVEKVMEIIDELMDTLQLVAPKIYNATMERLRRPY